MLAARVNGCRSPWILMSPLLAWSSWEIARSGRPAMRSTDARFTRTV